ncbi:P2 family phage major capsid protein [Phaeobacter inhibens]|uniref:P2 family phage major capsid protein n=1 Tax=Phaeobacter inhibens TaxID=221822 RepID=UPI000C9B132D|nr:P2 family phage major capsid protein [Phaeobacter inhibens]AUQ62338.1 capsid protein [Phaeobacter inhibens]AUQ91340.1 capsid protein [Phaeobacter inhibens]
MSLITINGQQIDDIVAVSKGMIDAEDLRNGGELKPQAASRLISMLFQDTFLTKITTERMTRLTKDVDVLDIMRRQLVRVPQGTDPDAGQFGDAAEFGCKLTALDVQLFPTLTLDFLRENKDNPNLLKEIETGFNTRLTTDLVDLGFNGIADDAAGADRAAKFIRLNKGWLQIMRDAANTPKIDIDPATDGWIASLRTIMDASDTRFRSSSVFLMNEADADEYARELNAPITGSAMNADSPVRRFEGKPIEAHPDMPRGSVAFTPLKNLVYGVSTDVRRDRSYHSRKRVLEYTFDMAVDYEVAVKQAAVLGE